MSLKVADVTGELAAGAVARHSAAQDPSVLSVGPAHPLFELETPAGIEASRISLSQRWRSSGWTPESHPSPNSCSRVRPLKASHPLLTKVQPLSGPATQIIRGATSAISRKRSSLSRRAASARRARNSVTSSPRLAKPAGRPSDVVQRGAAPLDPALAAVFRDNGAFAASGTSSHRRTRHPVRPNSETQQVGRGDVRSGPPATIR